MSERLREVQTYRGGVWPARQITFASALLLSAMAGCAPAARPTAMAPEGPAGLGGPAYATVDAVRAVPPVGAAVGSDPQAQSLAAMGVSAPAGAGGLSEVVVRTDDGQTLSVVEANAGGLAPGDRVMIIPGAVPRLTRPAS